MADLRPEKKNRINERIVPRNNFKHILGITVTVLVMAVLFGVVSGVMFKISETLVGNNVETRIEQFIIARDETDAESDEETHSTKEIIPKTSEAPSTAAETAAESTVAPTQEITLSDVLEMAQNSVVTVSIEKNTGTDFFDAQIIGRRLTLGVFVAESTESLFFLVDDSGYEAQDIVSVVMNDVYIPAAFVETDALTGMTVYKIPIDAPGRKVPLMMMGNSLSLSVTDPVYMIGTQFGIPNMFSEGKITLIDSDENTEDGYVQHIYTDIVCGTDASGFLLNEKGEMIGWVSDCFRGDRTVVSAGGISPLKYVVEDLCSGAGTAYMGVVCRTISKSLAAMLQLNEGLYVEKVAEGSPAFDAGIQVGDQIVSIGDKNVQSSSLLARRLDDYRPGEQAEVRIRRRSGEDYAELTLTVTFGTR